MTTLNLNGHLIDLSKPLIMGILNITQDSFYDGGRYNQADAALVQVDKMLSEGADIIDIGAFSSRPGAEMVTAKEQLEQLVPIVEKVLGLYPEAKLSIDTWSSEVVSELAKITSFIVNDISGFQYDEQLIPTVAEHRLPYILMHIQGKPADMSEKTQYDDVSFEVLKYFAGKLHTIKASGINDIIIDPGFGFAKTTAQNFELLAKLNVFNVFDLPVMVGLSRKSMIYKTLGIQASEALNGTTSLHMAALLNGAKILRVHDVKEASESRTLWAQLHSAVNN